MDTPTKVRENRLRRMAKRQGLRLMVSRRRDCRAIDYGTIHLVNERNFLEYSTSNGYDLDQVEKFLTRTADE